MSLSVRLSAVVPSASNRGCRTCKWLDGLSPSDRAAWDDWLRAGLSRQQLWEVAAKDPDNPLPVSLTGFRHHLAHDKAAHES